MTDQDDFAQEHLAAPSEEQPSDPSEATPPQQWSGAGPPEPEQHGGQPAKPQSPGYPPPPQPWRQAGPPPTGGTGYQDETQAFAAPRFDQHPGRQQPAPPRERPAARHGGQWPPSPGQHDRPDATPPTGWDYVEGIRTSELVPTRVVPPGRGWRRLVYNATFGMVNPGQSPDDLRQAELETKARTRLRGHYKIGVLGKGGVGKTTVAVSVCTIFAQLRQEDRVVAIDADTSFGKLGARVDPQTPASYWDLAADDHLDTFADVRARVGNNADGLFVLPGESAAARRRVLDPAIYREATARLDRHFTISIVDCGSTMDSPVTQEVLRDLDALIVVSSPWVDGASVAGQTMEWLAAHEMIGLLHRTVVVLNDSDGHANARTRTILAQQFASRGQVVIEVPFDPHLRPGGVIDVTNQMRRKTRRRFLEIAAVIAEHFADTAPAPRERRFR